MRRRHAAAVKLAGPQPAATRAAWKVSAGSGYSRCQMMRIGRSPVCRGQDGGADLTQAGEGAGELAGVGPPVGGFLFGGVDGQFRLDRALASRYPTCRRGAREVPTPGGVGAPPGDKPGAGRRPPGQVMLKVDSRRSEPNTRYTSCVPAAPDSCAAVVA
jgi:hypothetical protein